MVKEVLRDQSALRFAAFLQLKREKHLCNFGHMAKVFFMEPNPRGIVMLGFSGEMSHPLSFVQVKCDGKTDFWAPRKTGDYAQDCDIGTKCAEELLEYLEEARDHMIFKSICLAITDSGAVTGTEVGFFSRIGITLIGLPTRS